MNRMTHLSPLIMLLAIVGLAAAIPGTARAIPAWQESEAGGDPPARFGGAMIHHEASGLSVHYAGFTSAVTASGQVHTYDGTTWEVAPFQLDSPGTRRRHAMIYDSARERAVMFGGMGSGMERDTWAWTPGSQWTLLTESGPIAREYHAMAYDKARDRVVLFGGRSDNGGGGTVNLGDTWEFDGTSWSQVAVGGPTPRWGHDMAYDEDRGRVVLFGGATDVTSALSDTWEWNGSSWVEIPTNGMPARFLHSMAWDAGNRRVVLAAGYGQNSLEPHSNVWHWEGDGWKEVDSSGLTPRGNASLAYDRSRGRLVLAGGRTRTSVSGPDQIWEGAIERPLWQHEGGFTNLPIERFSHAMTYDSIRSRVVLFGGTDTFGPGGNILRDTWEWDGSQWHRRSTAGPEARTGSAMAFDSDRGRVVLFGGQTPNYLADTWEWDGEEWTEVPTTNSPSPRSNHSMTYDSNRGRILLHGGNAPGSGNYLNDTWEFDGTNWVVVHAGGAGAPPARGQAAMAFHEGAGHAMLFGGTDGSANYNETWTWNGSVWTERSVPSGSRPNARLSHAMAYDEARDRVVLFGGIAGGADTWEWSGSAWTRFQEGGQVPFRSGFTMAYDSANEVMIMFGGRESGGDTSNSHWTREGTLWRQVHPGPSPRDNHAMVHIPERGETLLFGGTGLDGERLGDTWIRSGGEWTLASTSGPSARSGHAMAYDKSRDLVVLFGGSNGADAFGDTWEWNGTAWNLASTSGPAARTGHAMVYHRTELMLFGGALGALRLDETWVWNGSTWAQVLTGNSPGPRSGHAMVFDEETRNTILFGGTNNVFQTPSDTWEWTGATWTQAATTGPSGRTNTAMAYDSGRERIILHGGNAGIPRLGDSWQWKDGAWIRLADAPPAARNGHAMVYEVEAGQTIVHGGTDANSLRRGDIWALRNPQPFTIPPAARAIGDFNDDGCVDFADFLFLLDNWGEEIDGNPIGFNDFLALLDNWGEGC